MQLKIFSKLFLLISGTVGLTFSMVIALHPIISALGRSLEVEPISVLTTHTPQDLLTDAPSESSRNMILPEQMNLLAQENLMVMSVIERAGTGLPIRLTIPKIGVDAPIMYVGLTSLGTMDAPKNPVDVAWFNQGSRPGESGSAVIAGHFGWKNGIPAAFDHLDKLRKGDTVSVLDEKDVPHTFVVRGTHIYGENDVASEVFISSDGKAHLNLVTCGGVWNKTKKSYSDRLVVFTDKEL